MKLLQVALVVANGMEEAERYLLYSCEALVDCKQLLVDVFIKKRKTVKEAQQMLRDVLLSLASSLGEAGAKVSHGDARGGALAPHPHGRFSLRRPAVLCPRSFPCRSL